MFFGALNPPPHAHVQQRLGGVQCCAVQCCAVLCCAARTFAGCLELYLTRAVSAWI